MTLYELLNKLENDGVLDQLFRSGVVSIKYVQYLDVYRLYDSYRRKPGFKKKDCIDFVCNDMNVSFRTVERILSNLTRQVVERKR